MPGSNHNEHAKDVFLAMDEVNRESSALVRTVGFELLSRTVGRTPRDLGRLAANWQMSLVSPIGGTIEGEDSAGDATIATGVANIKTYELGQDIWLTNNLVYAPVWEFGLFEPPDPGPSSDPRPGREGEILVAGGYSLQAPEGMLGVSVQEVATAFG